MALDRDTIERNDFPIGRRGYEPAAVDAHLREVADEVEQLARSARARAESLSTAASEQVRTIIEAAEKSATEIQERVEEEARQIRAEARRDARKERADAKSAGQAEREQASAEARDYVQKVSDATSQMLKRLDATETELGDFADSLRAGSTRLKDELETLGSDMRGLAVPSGGVETEPDEEEPEFEPAADATEAEPEPEVAGEAEIAATESVAEPALVVDPQSEPEPSEVAVEPTAQGGGDAEGARLIALNMALNGTPRDETDRYLAENFELSDRGRLLDEVYASVEG